MRLHLPEMLQSIPLSVIIIFLLIVTFIPKSQQERKIFAYTDSDNTHWSTGVEIVDEILSNNPLTDLLSTDVSDIAVSEFHSVFLTRTGELYGSGSNLNGQLGKQNINNETTRFTLNRITSHTVISACAMGSAFDNKTKSEGRGSTLFLTDSNRLYALGSNEYGNLGIGQLRDANGVSPDFYIPTRVFQQGSMRGKTIKNVKCGLENAFALTTDGLLFAWGYNGATTFATGAATTDEVVYVPTQVFAVDNDDTIEEVFPGYLNGFILSSKGRLYGFGRGISGEFGTPWAVNLFFPTELSLTLLGDAKHIAPGKYYTLVLTEDSNHKQFVYWFGDATALRYGLSSSSFTPQNVTLPTTDRIATIEAAYENGFLISNQGKVFMTGASSLIQTVENNITTSLLSNGTTFVEIPASKLLPSEHKFSVVRAKTHMLFLRMLRCGNDYLDSDYSVCSGRGSCTQMAGTSDGYCFCDAGFSNSNGSTECSICQAGRFKESIDMYTSQCTDCPFGTYNPSSGVSSTSWTSACLSCPTGHYTDAKGSTALANCKACPAGEYVNEEKNGCLKCPAGTYSTKIGAADNSTCTLCPLGTYNELHGQEKCIGCPGGSVTLDHGSLSSENCTPCTSGSYSVTDNGITYCEMCPAGTYNALEKQTSLASCRFCISGTYQPVKGATSEDSCIKCPQGTFSSRQGAASNTTCEPCDFGTYNDRQGGSSNIFCLECPLGTYGASKGLKLQSECSPCPSGTYGKTTPLKSILECIPCSRQDYQDQVGQTQCIPCPTGSMAINPGANSSALCLPCGKGSYFVQVNETRECYACPPGTYSDTDSALSIETCKPCRAGTFSPTSGASSLDFCRLCPSGTYGPRSGANSSLACITCPDNYFALNGSSSCTQCPPGHLSREIEGQSTCVPAPRGFYTDNNAEGVLSIFPCPEGTYSNKTAAESLSSCTPCPKGFYSTEKNSTSCTIVTEGYYQSQLGQSSQLACAPGSYTNLTGQKSCTLCADGYYTPNTASTSCIASNIGHYVPTTGSNARVLQQQCPEGTFQNKTAQTSCENCADGYYTSNNASTSCIGSEIGHYVPTTGSDARVRQRQCPEGTFQNKTAQTSCEDCAKGYYSSSLGTIICAEADPGYHVPTKGSRSQTQCPPGEFNNATHAASCVLCYPGTFTPHNGSIACNRTAPGHYQPSHGQTFELPCDAGMYQDSWETTSCKPCDQGTYAPKQRTVQCIDASLGHFVNVTGSNVQYKALPGTYINQKGASSGTSCPKNTYRISQGGENVEDCSVCSPGTYSLAIGATSSSYCQPCMSGYYCEGTRDTKSPFLPCPAGTYNSHASKWQLSQCLICPLGNYCEEHASSPSPCDIGHYQDAFGAKNVSYCTPCSPGHYSTLVASNSKNNCLPCPMGTENQLYGQDTCVPCIPGYYSPVEGLKNCHACEPGFYMPLPNATSCLSCPTGTASNLNASTTVKHCVPCPTGSYAYGKNSSDCSVCESGICPTGSSSVLPVVQQFLEPVSQIINPQDSLTSGDQATLVKWIPIGIVALFTLVFVLLLTCVSCCLNGRHDPCRLFSQFDMFFKLHHHVKLHDSPVKKRTVVGGLLSIIACTVIFCFIYSSAVDLFMNNTFLSETFRIGEIQTTNTSTSIRRYRATLYIFGNHPECSTFQVSASGFVGNVPVNGTCQRQEYYDDTKVDSCMCRWECIDCSHEGVKQKMAFKAQGIFSSILAYELSVPHYLTEPNTNYKRFYSINGTILPPSGRVFYGIPENPVQVFFSIFNSQYIKQSSFWNTFISFVEFFGVIEQPDSTMTGLTSQLLSIAAGETAVSQENDEPDKGLFVEFDIELSAFIFLLQERSIQTSLNFVAQVAALSSAVIAAMRLLLMGFEMFILNIWAHKLLKSGKKKRKKSEVVDDMELDSQDLDDDDDEKKLSVSNKSKFGGNQQKGLFTVPVPETAAFTSDSIFADDILLSSKSGNKPSQQPASRIVNNTSSTSLQGGIGPTSNSARRKRRKDNRKAVFHDCRLLTVTQQYQLNEWYGMRRQEWDLAYRATKHGFQGKEFHQRVDGRGPTFTIIKTQEGYVFGGFLLPDWTSDNSWIRTPSSDGAWLFSIFNPEMEKIVQKGDDCPVPVLIPCIDLAKAAFGGQLYGPIFGAGNDIFCSNMSNDNQNSNTNLGKSYQTEHINQVNGVSQKFLCGSKNFTVSEIESFTLHVQ
eukprot:CAMPEP_0117442670 /NCGR_PEP_ID=MMETSP0759-20121206/4277_1 /TAXON_ID=63605 /ORGANISM="Percolomonas cosmopolitus, Strain WS" /LENGTH=2194 /DNA_ID=CAMNT_0005234577 /DNA_START=309 /DNA_END=6893 /DNA_ORIENTATION=-